MPEGFFRAGKVIFGRYACRMARKMNAVCLKKHPADRVRWLCIQVLRYFIESAAYQRARQTVTVCLALNFLGVSSRTFYTNSR